MLQNLLRCVLDDDPVSARDEPSPRGVQGWIGSVPCVLFLQDHPLIVSCKSPAICLTGLVRPLKHCVSCAHDSKAVVVFYVFLFTIRLMSFSTTVCGATAIHVDHLPRRAILHPNSEHAEAIGNEGKHELCLPRNLYHRARLLWSDCFNVFHPHFVIVVCSNSCAHLSFKCHVQEPVG